MSRVLPNDLFFREVESLLAEGRSVRIRMKGHSMRPLLRNERDLVVLERCDAGSLRPGDIVLFRYAGRHILHRILHREGARFTLAGDGNYRIREHCTADEIVARAVQVIRPSGRIVACDSKHWQRLSKLWLSIPQWLRRQVLRIMWHLGVR